MHADTTWIESKIDERHFVKAEALGACVFTLSAKDRVHTFLETKLPLLQLQPTTSEPHITIIILL